MGDELDRAFAFMARGDMAGTDTEETVFGTAVRSTIMPLRQDSNYLLVTHGNPTAAELADELTRRGLRVVVVPDQAAGARLVDGFAALGWNTHPHLVMVHRRTTEHTADTSLVREVDKAALRAVRRDGILAEPWGSPELADQLLAAKRLISHRLDARFFAVLVEGAVVAYADLYLADGAAQIEDVATLPDHRNRGYASAVVLRAIDEARGAGATFIFLVARADDWPQHLYERLGFETIGGYFKFFA